MHSLNWLDRCASAGSQVYPLISWYTRTASITLASWSLGSAPKPAGTQLSRPGALNGRRSPIQLVKITESHTLGITSINRSPFRTSAGHSPSGPATVSSRSCLVRSLPPCVFFFDKEQSSFPVFTCVSSLSLLALSHPDAVSVRWVNWISVSPKFFEVPPRSPLFKCLSLSLCDARFALQNKLAN